MTLLILIESVALSLVPSANPAIVDLNHDAKADTVYLQCDPGSWSYTLTINDASYHGRGEALEGTFSIVDIDTTDALLEVAVPQYGPSDDYATYFHSYDGRSVHFMNVVPGTYELRLDGSGRIRTSNRGNVLQTWFYPCVYRLDEHHSLHQIIQELYPMGTRCTVKLTLPLCASRLDTSTVSILRPGDVVTIVASDDKRWCLVQGPDDAWGWFELSGFDSVLPLGKPAWDVFEGLSYAD